MDVTSIEEVSLKPGEHKLIKTGLRAQIPWGFELQVRPRSGMALKHGITVLNSPGTIDCDYRGDIGIILINHNKEFYFDVHVGDRIAQLVLCPVMQGAEIEEVTELHPTVRGEGGYGSTGIK